MMRLPALPLCLATALLSLSACNGSKPSGGGNVAMRDMEVVDGTANDSMADLDNATADGTPLSNAGGLPGAVPMGGKSGGAPSGAPADSGGETASPDKASPDKSANAGAPE
ncbi:MAG: hypothetical protein QM690_15105 [Sphingobium sp.]